MVFSSFGDTGNDWNDEGLFFTIVVHAGLAAIFLLVLACLQGSERLKRVLRPSRPHSTGPRFATAADTAALFSRSENEVAMRVSVRAAMQLLLVKYRAFIFIGGLASAIALTIICGTDQFVTSFAANTDAFDCKAHKNEKKACENIGWCVWTNVTVSGSSVTSCTPTRIAGLYDLTLMNITPTHFRGWLLGLFHLLFHLWVAYCIGSLLVELRVLAFSSKTMPVQLVDTKPLEAKMGSRAVRIPLVDGAQCRAFDGSAASLFPEAVAMGERVDAAAAASAAAAANKAPDAAAAASAPVAQVARMLRKNVVAATVCFEAPVCAAADDKTIVELMQEQDAIVDELSELVAKQRLGEGGDAAAAAKNIAEAEQRLAAVRTHIEAMQAAGLKKLKKQREKQQQQDATADAAAAAAAASSNSNNNPLGETYAPWKVTSPTHAFLVFDSATHAVRFLQLIDDIVAGTSPASVETKAEAAGADLYAACIAAGTASNGRGLLGPASHLDHAKLAPATCGSSCATAVSVALYVLLVLFSTSIVAFFGSIDRLASIPVVSDVFGPVVRDIPRPLFRILQAYLPVILLALFQLCIPAFVRAIVHGGSGLRVPNWELRDALSFRMIFVYMFVSGVLLQTVVQGGLFTMAAVVWRHSLGDVLNFLTSMFSPKGGYFFALVASSTTCSQLMQLFSPGAVASALCCGGCGESAVPETRRKQREAARRVETDLYAALSMFIFSVGILYHTTSPLLAIFVCVYFVTAYYCTRAVYLDVEDRDPATNPASDATLSNEFFLAQVRYMLGLHALGTVGTFVVLCFKYLWGGAAMSVAGIVINLYLWNLKSTVLDPVLDGSSKSAGNSQEEALLLVDHYEHMLGFFAGKIPPKPNRVPAAEQEELEEKYLPAFAKYSGEDPWPARRAEVLLSIEGEKGRKYQAGQE